MPDEIFRITSAYDEHLYLEMPIALVEVQGLGMPPMTRRTSKAPFQHGETFQSFVLEPRILQLILHLRGCSREDLWEQKQVLYRIINPLLGECRFQVGLRDGTIYWLEQVFYDGQFSANVDTRGEPDALAVATRMVAHDPVWYGAAEHSETFSADLLDELVLPAAFPIMFGLEETLEDSAIIVAGGTWDSYPTIQLYGPMSDPWIYSVATDEKLELAYDVAVGELVTIATTPGYKRVYNNLGADDLVKYLTDDSDLATFRLVPHPIATNGNNEIQVRAHSCTDEARVVLQWYDRYIGI